MFYEGLNRRLQSSDYLKKANNWTFVTSSYKPDRYHQNKNEKIVIPFYKIN